MGLVRRRQGGVAVAVSALQDQNRRPPGGRCSPAGSAAPALVACKNTPALKGRGSGGTLEGSAVQWAVQPRRRAPSAGRPACGAAVLAGLFTCSLEARPTGPRPLGGALAETFAFPLEALVFRGRYGWHLRLWRSDCRLRCPGD